MSAELAERARGWAQKEPPRSPMRRFLHELADALEGKVDAPPSSSNGITYEEVLKFQRARNVKVLPWQRKRLQGPETMRFDGEEWVEL